MTAAPRVPSPARPPYSPWPHRRRLWGAAAVALAVHAGIYFSGKPVVMTGVEFGMEEPPATVEVALVESAPPEPVAPPPAPEPPAPEPIPEPPKPEPKPKEESIPLPPEPKLEPKPEQKPKPAPRPQPKPSAQRTTTTSSTTAPTQRTTGTTGAATGVKGGTTSGPGHLYNPKPAYPAESRAAKEHGTVLLSVAVDAAGRPGSVRLSQSSGFTRLDRAAQEAVRRWRFRPAMRNGVPYASNVTVPIRFALPR